VSADDDERRSGRLRDVVFVVMDDALFRGWGSLSARMPCDG